VHAFDFGSRQAPADGLLGSGHAAGELGIGERVSSASSVSSKSRMASLRWGQAAARC
jgi:hypothetical protein